MGSADDEEHSSAIKTPKQLAAVLLAAFVFPIAIIMLLIQLVTGDTAVDPNDPMFSDEAVAKRLKPVGLLVFAGDSPETSGGLEGTSQMAASATAAPIAGPAAAQLSTTDNAGKIEAIYAASCAACHTTGAAGAPKLGDKSTWAPRIKSGTDALYISAIKGKNAMPAKGGNSSLSDDDVKAVVDYMVSQAK